MTVMVSGGYALLLRLMLAEVTPKVAIPVADPAPAAAEAAEAAIAQGIRLRRERRDAEALAEFRRAHELAPSPRTLAQVALAEQALGLWVQAEQDLKDALRADHDPWIAARVVRLRSALARVQENLGSLSVVTNVPGGQLWLNGTSVGDLPTEPQRVVAGAVDVEVRWKDQPPFRETVLVPAGATVTERIERLTLPRPEPVRAATSPVAPGPSRVRADVRAPHLARELPAEASWDAQRTLGFVTLGASGSLLAGALAALIVHADRVARYNDDARCLYGDLTRNQRCGTYRGQADTAERIAIAGFIGAAALGTAAGVLLFTTPSAAASEPLESNHAKVNLSLSFGLGSATASATW